jgi:hypothetical protein
MGDEWSALGQYLLTGDELAAVMKTGTAKPPKAKPPALEPSTATVTPP